MTEHSEPRRYTLYCREQDGRNANVRVLETDGSELGWGDRVEVREDKACEADVEGVCQLLEADYSGIEELARAILSTIFKEGGEQDG